MDSLHSGNLHGDARFRGLENLNGRIEILTRQLGW